MSVAVPEARSLVLYRNHPARVLAREADGKLAIEIQGGKTQRVRPKDVTLLHPGPVTSLSDVQGDSGTGELEEAWELLAGEETRLAELSELVFGDYSPQSAWATWALVSEGTYFSGTPEAITAHTREAVAAVRDERARREQAEQEWEGFLQRLRRGTCAAEDAARLTDVELLADGRADKSRVLQALGREQTPENAHRLLLKIGHWAPEANPHPHRLGLSLRTPEAPVPELPDGPRRDLTGLPAFAIDDVGNQDPDDAVSWDGERLWVHVADVAALVAPGSELDRVARERGANLYLPERTAPMLPPGVTHRLGLGLEETSPALSFALSLSEAGEIADVSMEPSRVRVTRLTYDEADTRLDEEPLATLARLARRFRERRRARGAAFISLPEVKIKVDGEGRVSIRRLPASPSRELVADAMLMTGEAVARFAHEHTIPFPFSTQPPPEGLEQGTDLATSYANRKRMRRSQMRASAEPHAGLGLAMYSQATSPLRRYLDLVLHQQLRSWVTGGTLLDVEAMLQRVGEIDFMIGAVRRAERQSNLHWTLVYLHQNPDWEGEAVVVEPGARATTVIIPELAHETRLQLGGKPARNEVVRLVCTEVDLPGLRARFRVA